MTFNVSTDYFRGPVDLLLFLVRRHEIEVSDVALAGITHKYLEYIDVLKEISIDAVGDFIEVASILVEMKARAVLPRNEHENDEEITYTDPREGLGRSVVNVQAIQRRQLAITRSRNDLAKSLCPNRERRSNAKSRLSRPANPRSRVVGLGKCFWPDAARQPPSAGRKHQVRRDADSRLYATHSRSGFTSKISLV